MRKIALIGTPNCGKSTLFNALTGLNQKVGNFSGVTVDKKTGTTAIDGLEGKVNLELTDLPGMYSLFPKSLDEKVSYSVLCDPIHPNHPDLTLVIIDASSPEKGIYLASQVVDLKVPVILVFNMSDLAAKKGMKIDMAAVQDVFGVPAILVNSRNKKSISELKSLLGKALPEPGNSLLNFNAELSEYTEEVQKISRAKSQYGAFQVLCNLGQISYFHKNPEQRESLDRYFKTIDYSPMKWQMWETLERHDLVKKISSEIIKDAGQARSLTDHTDAILLHPLWGVLFFIGVMTLMFQSVFSWASLPMEWIEFSFSTLITYLQGALPSGFLTDLLLNGILAGLSGVIVFVPQIAFLFLFISLLEDSGYMARVSFLLDYFMRRFGLSGRSVIPLIGGFACAIPAIMATRSISNQKDRLITMLITPLMSCSARLPVYTLLIALVIPSTTSFFGLSAQGVTLAGLYFLGIIAGLVLAFILSKSIKAKEEGFFMLELPTYKWPDPRNTITNIFEKVRIFLWDAGKIIVAISILLWLLSSYGPGSSKDYLTEKYSTAQEDEVAPELRDAFMADKLEYSYAGILGRKIEPVIAPLGYDWKIGIAIITSFAAREVFVGTLATIFSVSDPEDARSIREKMAGETNRISGKKQYDLPMGLSLMVFYAFALQCMSTIAVMRRESGGWKWPTIQFVLMGAMAYLGALLTYQMLI